MSTNQLSRLVYRQDQLLQLPLPQPPALARHIANGVLKKEGAVAFDVEQRQDREKIQNVLRQFLRWPKLEEWQAQVTNVTNLITNITTIQTTIVQQSADLTALTALVNAQTSLISALESSLLSLTVFVNQVATERTPQRGNGPPDSSVVARYDGDEYWDLTGGPGTYRWYEARSEWLSM